MAQRYVWEKWNCDSSTNYSCSFYISGNKHSEVDNEEFLIRSSFGSTFSYVKVATSGTGVNGYTVSVDSNGTFLCNGSAATSSQVSGVTMNSKNVYFIVNNEGTMAGVLWLNSAYTAGRAYTEVNNLYYRLTGQNTYIYYEFYKKTSSLIYSKGSTSYGNISSASSGAYPSNGASGNYWYVLQGNDCIDPSAVSYSTPAPKGGEMIDVTVTPGTNTYGGTVSYKYEYSLDGSTWTVANSGTTGTTVSILIPAGSTQFQARVTASDDMGFTSPDAIAGTALTVTNNTAPVITCATSALGEITTAFTVAYSVSDADGNTMTITEALDGTAFNTFTTTGGNQTLTIDADRLLRALNGAHTLTITVDDGNGGVTTHSITFTKAVYTATITRAEPMDADDRIAIMVMHVVGSIPADADYKVEVTNNALDASPVWEDVTSYIKNDNIKNYSFANTTCTSGTWAFNFRVTVSRGSSGVGGYITSLDGAFEGSVA